MDKEEMMKRFKDKVRAWEESQRGQTSGFEYEKSFDEMWTELGREVLEESLGEEPSDRKKNS
jgi:hypothetical protein